MAIAVAILAVVLTVFWVQSCQGESKERSYRDYVEDVTAVAVQSQGVGRQLTNVLTTPGVRSRQLQVQLNGLVQAETQNLERAERLDPPGRLREAHEHAIEALQFRRSGLAGLSDAIAGVGRTRNVERAGRVLANQARRFLASDVVWDDRFKDPTKAVLRREEIGGVVVPDSNFFRNADLASSESLAEFVRRLQGASTGGGGTPTGLRGTNLVSVTVQPEDDDLSTAEENIVTVTLDLAFEVTVENSGNAQLLQVPVTLTIQKRPGPNIVKRQTIDVMNPGQTRTLTFRDVGRPDFGPPRTVRVEVKPVPGETRTTNNSATYTVTFTLPQ